MSLFQTQSEKEQEAIAVNRLLEATENIQIFDPGQPISIDSSLSNFDFDAERVNSSPSQGQSGVNETISVASSVASGLADGGSDIFTGLSAPLSRLNTALTLSSIAQDVSFASQLDQGENIARDLIGQELVKTGIAVGAARVLAYAVGLADGPQPGPIDIIVQSLVSAVATKATSDRVNQILFDTTNPNRFGDIIRNSNGEWVQVTAGKLPFVIEDFDDIALLNGIRLNKQLSVNAVEVDDVQYFNFDDNSTIRYNNDGSVTEYTQNNIFRHSREGDQTTSVLILKAEQGLREVPVIGRLSDGSVQLDWSNVEFTSLELIDSGVSPSDFIQQTEFRIVSLKYEIEFLQERNDRIPAGSVAGEQTRSIVLSGLQEELRVLERELEPFNKVREENAIEVEPEIDDGSSGDDTNDTQREKDEPEIVDGPVFGDDSSDDVLGEGSVSSETEGESGVGDGFFVNDEAFTRAAKDFVLGDSLSLETVN